MLATRLVSGCPVTELSPAGRSRRPGKPWPAAWPRGPALAGAVRLTRPGRLLADAVIRDLTD